ncbi:MAG: hypothetical protein CO189_12365 [candidate division Zixibacteria bacterium CG_4_9_14_3_um_filter_46_8]|nr:MAG: hypothetical protein CO189_12365 [candidate division Zixibacteria bacterium CG_4_9_14_3_um_filter_46_8]
MFNRKSHALRGFILLAIIIGIVLVNGCGKLSPTGPQNDQAIQKEAFGIEDIEAQWGKTFKGGFLPNQNQQVGTNEDSILIDCFGYKSIFRLPAGSVRQPTLITIAPSRYLTASGAVYVFNFGPEGLNFNESTTLGLDISALEAYNPNPGVPFPSIKFYWWNTSTSTWDLQESDSDFSDGNADFHIDHFSRYAISG